jgi:hypothetical protein
MKQSVIISTFASLFALSAACSKDSKKSPQAESENPPVEQPEVIPAQPVSEPVQPVSTTQAARKMVGLRFGSEYLTLRQDKIYNADASGQVQSEVQEVHQSLADANDIQELPVIARPRRIDPLNDEFFLLLQPEYNTCHMGSCEWGPSGSSMRPQSNYLINKKSGEAWEIESNFVPVPGSVKFVENDRQKTVFFLAHDVRDRRFWDYYPYDAHYATSLKEQFFVYGRKTLIAIDISRPDQKILQPISGNLNVANYEVDRNGNAVVTDLNVESRTSTYLIARNGTQPVINLVKNPEFHMNSDRSYFFRDQAGNLYHFQASPEDVRSARIAKMEIRVEDGRAVAHRVKETPFRNIAYYGSSVAAIREDKDNIYLALKGDLMVLKKDFSAVKVISYSTQNYLEELYMEVLPEVQKVFIAGRSNQVLVVSQVDLNSDTTTPINVEAIEGKLQSFGQNDGAMQMVTVDEATDTTLVYGLEQDQKTFNLLDRKLGQVDDRLRILVKVSGPVEN